MNCTGHGRSAAFTPQKAGKEKCSAKSGDPARFCGMNAALLVAGSRSASEFGFKLLPLAWAHLQAGE